MKLGAKLGIVFIALALLATPFLSNAGYDGKMIEIETTVMTPLGKQMKTVQMSEKDLNSIIDKVDSTELQDALISVQNPETEEDEKSKAMEIVEAFIEQLQDTGLIPDAFPVANILGNFLSPKASFILPILSFGHGGITWIPLYPGEAFIGFMFRPIFIQYFGPFAYTATVNVHLLPPRIEYWDLVGTHTMFVLGFVGVYIDLGEIGFGIPDFQFMFGEAFIAGGIDWI